VQYYRQRAPTSIYEQRYGKPIVRSYAPCNRKPFFEGVWCQSVVYVRNSDPTLNRGAVTWRAALIIVFYAGLATAIIACIGLCLCRCFRGYNCIGCCGPKYGYGSWERKCFSCDGCMTDGHRCGKTGNELPVPKYDQRADRFGQIHDRHLRELRAN